MNLEKLFQMQKELDARILAEHPEEGEDRLAKKVLALLVELGELAQEWRGFKFWSEDQEPRTGGECCCDDGYFDIHMGNGVVEQGICPFCEGIGELPNTLLEEYVDCLHFILSIGLDITDPELIELREIDKAETITEQFIMIFDAAGELYEFEYEHWDYESLLIKFVDLGEMLGFTWEEVEEYFQKNVENHARQERGY